MIENALSTIGDKIFWQFTVFLCKFGSSQVQQNMISSIIKFVYELPHKLSNGLRLRILGIYEIRRKSQN